MKIFSYFIVNDTDLLVPVLFAKIYLFLPACPSLALP
jgi:hypothetical protein